MRTNPCSTETICTPCRNRTSPAKEEPTQRDTCSPPRRSRAPSASQVGRRLRQLRTEQGLSLRDLAGRLGISRSTLQRYETHGIDPGKVCMLLALGKVLGVESSYFLESGEPSPDTPEPAGSKSTAPALEESLRRFIRRLKKADLAPSEEQALCMALSYILDLFGGLAGNWAEASGEVRAMRSVRAQITPTAADTFENAADSMADAVFNRRMSKNIEALHFMADALPRLWGRERERFLFAMKDAASGGGFTLGKGRGSLRQKGRRWYYRFYLTGEDGKSVQREFAGGESREDAEEKLRRAVYEYENGLRPEGGRMNVWELMEKWLAYLKTGSCSNGTLMLYRGVVGRIARHPIARKPLRAVTASDLQEYLDELSRPRPEDGEPLSTGYLRVFRAVLQGAFKYAVFPARLLTVNPMEYVVLQSRREDAGEAQQKGKTLRHEEFSALCRALEGTAALLPVQIAYYTGLRIGEVAALSWEDVDLPKRMLTVRRSLRYNGAIHCHELGPPKSGRARRVAFGETLYAILSAARRACVQNRRYKNYCRTVTDEGRRYDTLITLASEDSLHEALTPVDFVCTRADGAAVSADLIEKTCRRAAEAAGLQHFHFHMLRHTYTTNLLRQGASPRDVQELLGHAEIATTMNVYAHSDEENKLRTAQLLDAVFTMKNES